jgi:predicted RNA-binding protein with PIN domain
VQEERQGNDQGREPARLVVDAMNVIGSRPTGWWHDRDGAVRLLVARLQKLARVGGPAITVVMDGRPLADLPEGEHESVRVLYASRGGRNAADDRIVELIDADPDPASLEVVTSDRDLVQRATSRGTGVRGARSLLEQLDRLEG